MQLPHALFLGSGYPIPALLAREITLFAIVWLRKRIVIETENRSLRAHDVARRHPGEEPDTFRLMDATGQILGVFPKKSPTTKGA